MAGVPDYDELQTRLDTALAELDEPERIRSRGLLRARTVETPDALTSALRTTLLALSAAMGECREAVPYSPLHPVLEEGTVRWCCNHNPQHCSTSR